MAAWWGVIVAGGSLVTGWATFAWKQHQRIKRLRERVVKVERRLNRHLDAHWLVGDRQKQPPPEHHH